MRAIHFFVLDDTYKSTKPIGNIEKSTGIQAALEKNACIGSLGYGLGGE